MSTLYETSLFGAGAWSVLSTSLGDTVTYTPASGSPSSITGVWLPASGPGVTDFDGRSTVLRGQLVVLASDVTAPAEGDSFTIGGVVYGVEAFSNGQSVVVFNLFRRVVKRIGPDDGFVGRG